MPYASELGPSPMPKNGVLVLEGGISLYSDHLKENLLVLPLFIILLVNGSFAKQNKINK